MNKVNLDMESKIMAIQAGALWGHANSELARTRQNGYALNGGRCPTVGVSGFILGGGIGPFTRSFGMGCDTLKEATIVTADGILVTVKDTDDPESPKENSSGHCVNKAGYVTDGVLLWELKPEDKSTFLSTMNNFYTASWPDQMTIDSSWLLDLRVPSPELAIRFLVYYDGCEKDFNRQIKKWIVHKDLSKLFFRKTIMEPSTLYLTESDHGLWKEETRRSYPENKSWSIYSSFIFVNDKATIEKVTAVVQTQLESFKAKFKGSKVQAQVSFNHAGGQATKRLNNATAYPWREAVFHTYIGIQRESKWDSKDMRQFCNSFKDALRPDLLTEVAMFANFPDRNLRLDEHEKAYYGCNMSKLREFKKLWDKDNFFNWAQRVKLTPLPSDMRPSGEDGVAETSELEHQQWANYILPATNDFVGMHELPYWKGV
ncbi:hypothetical protein N431DRAFT_463012 [Stipitochalara longipes BDJ]|nr:hypothetical protein N431DRAFT_463012 [Stipitochalara longipes BDJ]